VRCKMGRNSRVSQAVLHVSYRKLLNDSYVTVLHVDSRGVNKVFLRDTAQFFGMPQIMCIWHGSDLGSGVLAVLQLQMASEGTLACVLLSSGLEIFA
jgi:hypothetical protein